MGEPKKIGGTNFLVTIYRQDNHDVQGVIQWLDTNRTVSFRSLLEMIHLMEEAVKSNQENALEHRNWIETSKAQNVI